MSLITGFNYDVYCGDLRMRQNVIEKLGISLSLMSAEDTERCSFVEVKVRTGMEMRGTPWKPIVKKGKEYPTLWDTRMGNFECKGFPTQPCTTCAATTSGGQQTATSMRYGNQRCPGHFGFISMPRTDPENEQASAERLFVYNPHMQSELETLLCAECFFCHRFRCDSYDVERYRAALILCDTGLVGEALHFLEIVPNARSQERTSKRRRDPDEKTVTDIGSLHRLLFSTLRRNDKDPEKVMKACAALTNKSSSGGSALPFLPRTSHNINGTNTTLEAVHKYYLQNEPLLNRDATTLDVRGDIIKMALKEFKSHPSKCTHCDAFSPKVTCRNSQFYFHFEKKANITHNVEHLHVLSLGQVKSWEAENKKYGRSRAHYAPSEARKHIKELVSNEAPVLAMLFPSLGQPTIETSFSSRLGTKKIFRIFFLDRIPVPPLPLRLQSGVQVNNGNIIPDDKTRSLSEIMRFVEEIEAFFILANTGTATLQQQIAQDGNLRNLQIKVNEVYTSIMDSFAKKEGLFRMNIMGKRVNQACRSVISPDFTVEPNEVLLPRPFARNLSFPEQVTFYSPARTAFLKQCAINGPTKYPGATHIEVRKSTGEVITIDLSGRVDSRKKNAAHYFALAQNGDTVIVHRHVLSGDRIIFNRQPTLHKPSMQGYRARVISGLKTLRFHYVNAKSFNADFDGDEMNVHVPQSLECRAELDTLMDANMNYIAPTSGKPIRGLIQDHIIAAVFLTLKDKFLEAEDFIQLVYYGLQPYLKGVATTDLGTIIPIPAILKPRALFTGKQLFSSILQFVSGCHRGNEGLTIKGISSIQPSVYGPKLAKVLERDSQGEHNLLVVNSILIRGVLCKNQLGPSANSIPHVLYEIHGPHPVGQFFGAIGRLLTAFLQKEGFSMGMDDMILTQEDERINQLDALDMSAINIDDEAKVMGIIAERSTKLQKEFVPSKLMSPFPKNNLVGMTQSGAKGSNTNAIQMSLVLGQQLFDGRRVKKMNSGKTLPSFFIGDSRARAFGYAMGCFASGIRPAEYTIHAMAGREGLIDTAIKTARSGYLQRCLIKGLESLVTRWDCSVRNSDGSIVQFVYGGDGLDPCKTALLNSYDIIRNNINDLGLKYRCESIIKEVIKGREKREKEKGNPPFVKEVIDPVTQKPIPSPFTIEGNANLRNIAAQSNANPLPAHLKSDIDKYVFSRLKDLPALDTPKRAAKWLKSGLDVNQQVQMKREQWGEYYRGAMEEVVNNKRLRSFIEAGEPVGLLAAQATGEPSTQMTLNTFHSAGSTVTHVTEGIPRLRELLMYASVQNGAVIVPVEKAKFEDFGVIQSILSAAVPYKLSEGLATLSHKSRVRFTVARREEATVLNVEMIFSKVHLNSIKQRMYMSDQEHVDSFRGALKQFSKQVVKVLRGITRNRSSDGGNNVIDAVQDPADLYGGDNNNNNNISDGMGDNDNDDDAMSTPSDDIDDNINDNINGKNNNNNNNDDDDDDDGNKSENNNNNEDNDSDGGSGRVNNNNNNASDEEEDTDDLPISSAIGQNKNGTNNNNNINNNNNNNKNKNHSTFEPIFATFGVGKFKVHIFPITLKQWLTTDSIRNGDQNNENLIKKAISDNSANNDNIFIVKMTIIMPAKIISVIPDVLASSIESVTFPTEFPQCDSASWLPSTNDPTTGELIFKGHGTSLKNVILLISLFSYNINSPSNPIKLSKAISTDIADMCQQFGVECGCKALFIELCKLFKRYSVDTRHLSLITDAATHLGVWDSFNFNGIISHSSSPLFQMTFASAQRFLHTALKRGVPDHLDSISASIFVGERPKIGTAAASVGHLEEYVVDAVERAFQGN